MIQLKIPMMEKKLYSILETLKAEHPFVLFGISKLERPIHFDFYKSWINDKMHGEMQYLERHLPIKEDPASQWSFGKSVITFAFPYKFEAPSPTKQLRSALYTRGGDYHFWIKAELEQIALKLSKEFPNFNYEILTDSKPLMERDFASKAGLGWIGKNTCLINRQHGSLFLLGEILTNLSSNQEVSLSHDFCGSCTRCIDACPTGAIEAPRKLNATKCISYLTIESQEIPEEKIRPGMNDWFFGCDICQTVCPWNQKAFTFKLDSTPIQKLDINAENDLINELRFILNSSGKSLNKHFAGTPLMRARPNGLKRNALIVIQNRKIISMKKDLENLLQQKDWNEQLKSLVKQVIISLEQTN